jgi:hypothetical protein
MAGALTYHSIECILYTYMSNALLNPLHCLGASEIERLHIYSIYSDTWECAQTCASIGPGTRGDTMAMLHTLSLAVLPPPRPTPPRVGSSPHQYWVRKHLCVRQCVCHTHTRTCIHTRTRTRTAHADICVWTYIHGTCPVGETA